MKSLISLIINMIGYVACSFVELFIKQNEKLCLFSSGATDSFSGNAKYLFELLENDKDFICFWVTKNREVYSFLNNQGKKVLFLYSLEAIPVIFKAKYIIGTSNNVLPFWLLSKNK
jgi:hypothetical protein